MKQNINVIPLSSNMKDLLNKNSISDRTEF